MEEGQLLIVDDEEIVLADLKRILLPAGLRIHLAGDAAEALKILDGEDIDIVLADFRMPRMDGLQFFTRVRRDYPAVHRVLMSSFLDEPNVLKFLNSGLATTFVVKTLKAEDLRAKMKHILEIKRLLNQRQLLTLINSIEQLPSLPSIYQEFLLAVEGGKAMPEIAEVIKRDPAVSAKVMHVVNSAFFGREAISSLSEAAVYLGVSVLKDIVLTAEIIGKTEWSGEQVRHLKEIFFHSFLMNKYIPIIYKALKGRPLSSHFPSVGIVHDIGKVLLLQFFTDRFESIVSQGDRGVEDSFYRGELSQGFEGNTHAEIGAYFLDWWNFPEVIVEVALFHHCPEKGSEEWRDLLSAANYADTLVNTAWAMGERDGIDLSSLHREDLPDQLISGIVVTIGKEIKSQEKLFDTLL